MNNRVDALLDGKEEIVLLLGEDKLEKKNKSLICSLNKNVKQI